MQKVLITGTSRGIGHETAKKFLSEGFTVLGTSTTGRSNIKNKNFYPYKLDLSNPESIKKVAKQITADHKGIDILINNAGILTDENATGLTIDNLRKTLEVNVFGLVDFTNQILPNLNHGASIVNVSSSMGSLTENFGGTYAAAYRVSKTALNMVTKVWSVQLRDKNILVSSLHPGWCATDMGGSTAPRDPKDAATDIFNIAIDKNIESGLFWEEGSVRDW